MRVKGFGGSSVQVLQAEQAELRAKSNCGLSTRGKEAGGMTTDTMNKNRIEGRRWLGKDQGAHEQE